MLRRFLNAHLPRLLFLASLGAALLLSGAVLVAPWFVAVESSMLLKLFALDGTVRRIALVSAGGLVVTAFLFFRSREAEVEPGRPPRQPPRTMAGA